MSLPLRGRASVAEIVLAVNELNSEVAPQQTDVISANSSQTVSPPTSEDPTKILVIVEGSGAVSLTFSPAFAIGSQVIVKEFTGTDRDVTVDAVGGTIDGGSSVTSSKGWSTFILFKLTSSQWTTLGLQAAALTNIDDFLEMRQNVEENKTISGANALSIGPVTVEEGITVSVEEGFRWVVV